MMLVISLGGVSRQAVSRHSFWKSQVAQQKQKTHQKKHVESFGNDEQPHNSSQF